VNTTGIRGKRKTGPRGDGLLHSCFSPTVGGGSTREHRTIPCPGWVNARSVQQPGSGVMVSSAGTSC
jgi:hypothetical protein